MKNWPERLGIQSFFKKRRYGIRKQVQHLIFICSIVAFFTVSLIALAGMLTARQNSITDGNLMGEHAAGIAADKLEYAEKRRLALLAQEQAKEIHLQLQRIEDRVQLLSGWVSYIYDNPHEYSPQPISFPQAENAGIVTAQLELAPGADYGALKDKIELAANASALMVRLSDITGEGTVVALGDEDGFYLSADDESDKHLTAEGQWSTAA